MIPRLLELSVHSVTRPRLGPIANWLPELA
jgi:hypothetical protein